MNKPSILGLSLGALALVFAACENGPSAPSSDAASSTEATPSALTVPAAASVAAVDRTLDAGGPSVATLTGGGDWDLVGDFTGDGEDDVVGNVLAVNAQRMANGQVQGQMEYQQSFFGDTFRFHGSVTCFSVYDDGTRAKFGGPITRSDDPALPVGLFMWFTVADNGDGTSGDLDKATIFGIGDEQANEDFCASPDLPPAIFFTEVTSGNFQVDG